MMNIMFRQEISAGQHGYNARSWHSIGMNRCWKPVQMIASVTRSSINLLVNLRDFTHGLHSWTCFCLLWSLSNLTPASGISYDDIVYIYIYTKVYVYIIQFFLYVPTVCNLDFIYIYISMYTYIYMHCILLLSLLQLCMYVSKMM